MKISPLTFVVALLTCLALCGCSKRKAQSTATAIAPPTAEQMPGEPPPFMPPSTSAVDAELDFAPVYFSYDSYQLDSAARADLDHLARILRETPTIQVTIEGHCDERGTVEYNQALGQRRAESVRNYLIAAGVAESRLSTISFGKERPFAEGSSESAWSENRRAHLTRK